MRWCFLPGLSSVATTLFLSLTLMAVGAATAQTVYEVPDGDGAGLRAALEQAAADGGSSVVRLAANGSYFVDSTIQLETDGPPAEIRLVGRRSAIAVDPCTNNTFPSGRSIVLGENIELSVEDLGFRFSCGDDGKPAFEVAGDLKLERVSVTGSEIADVVFFVPSGGSLSADNLTVAGNLITNRRGAFNAPTATGLVDVEAESSVSFRHLTLAQNVDSFDLPVPLVYEITSDQGIRIANSVVTVTRSTCGRVNSPPFIDSEGGNWVLVDAFLIDPAMSDQFQECEFAAGTDFVGPGGLNPVEAINFSIPIVTLPPESPAIDLGVDAFCARTDARGESRRAPCDAGAFEDRPFGLALTDGGWNGLWKNQESNGHYLTVMQNLQGRVVMFWTTFDYDGNPAWIYAIGSVGADNAIRGEAFVNEGGVMTPAGVPLGQEAEEWGTFEAEFSDCFNGVFRYATDDPAFPPQGEFTLDRLSRVQNLGCSDEE